MQSFRDTVLADIFKRKTLQIVGVVLSVLLLLLSCDVYEQKGSGIYSLNGKVLDGDGNGVEGAVVYLDGENRKTTTDSSGTFKIENVPANTVTLVAEKTGKILVPAFDAEKITSNGNSINVEYSTDSWDVVGCNFLMVDKITIPLIQGTGDISPLNGVQVEDVIGVVTQVCFEQKHNNPNFTTPDPGNNELNRQVLSNDGFYMQLLPNTSIKEIKADGNALTSDGIFVSTRNPKGGIGETSWLDACLIDGRYPQPGEIVRVSGVVAEFAKPDRFGESRGLNTRTQINASKVVKDTAVVSSGSVDIADANLLRLTYENLGSAVDQDSFRTVPFNDKGVDALKRASSIFESCEGMLVRIQNPIVIGATYYNTTPVLADGGKKNGEYPSEFNKKWMAPVVQENDFNTEIIYTYYDSLDIGSTFAPDWYGLPQIGTVLTDDTYEYTHGGVADSFAPESSKVFRGVMDYSDNGNYIIYPLRTYNLNTKKISHGVDYSHLSIKTHDNFRYALNDEAPADSLYMMGDRSQQQWIHYRMGSHGEEFKNTAQYCYKPWKSGATLNEAFARPWETDDEHISVAVFNMENYIEEGVRFEKYCDFANVFINNLKLPDLIFVVEMGDQDSSDETIIYNNSGFSQTNITGVVGARLNYETLIKKIAKESGCIYDYRQIDPVEYTQAGKPGANIRVGFMFRTDRIEAYDLGLPTIHMENCKMNVNGTDENVSVYGDYRIPENMNDEHESYVFTESGYERFYDKYEPKARKAEPALTLETKKVLAETQTEVIREYDDNGNYKGLTLTQSPGFMQDGRFYNSRLPLVGKFKFKPTGEDFFAIAMHLYSKGRDDKLYGNIQPPVMTSEIRRAGQSAAVKEFIDGILAMDPNAKIIVGGDVNDFGFTYPIKKMTGEGTSNQVLYDMTAYYMPENERFSYTFNGNLQQLDHVFVSPSLYRDMNSPTPEKHAGDWNQHVFVPHINSMFSRDRHIQISDHDPITARIGM